MKKRDELIRSDSCLNKAAEDEFVFVLREKDEAISNVIRFWIQERIRLGLNQPGDSKLECAEREASAIDARRAANKS